MTSPSSQTSVDAHGFVTACDGTPLAYWRSGSGSPLLLFHGTSADHRRWQPVLPALEERFTVYNIDRRGRGGSGDTDPYLLDREVDDIVAAVAAIGEPVDIIGHSYGGLCALEAAPRIADSLRRLILYEPPMNVTDVPLASPEVIDRLDALMLAGDRDGIVSTLMSELVGVPPAALARMRLMPAWQGRLAAAHTIPRELRTVAEYRFDPERVRDVATPTLLLVGGESPANVQAVTQAIAAALPNARTAVLAGQGHVAMDSAPELFMSEVLRFLMTA